VCINDPAKQSRPMIQREFEHIGGTDGRIDIERKKEEERREERKVRLVARSERRQTKVEMTGRIP